MLRALIKSMRPRQWTKNIIVYAALVFDQQFFHLEAFLRTTAGFVLFCEPWQYFWVTGTLSALLDNAPTYLTFLATALGRFFEGVGFREAVHLLVEQHPLHLEAISAGAVYMGAMTYIGNAPNFMVRSLAEEAGVAMPSFFGYVLRWSIPILVPILILMTLIFFH